MFCKMLACKTVPFYSLVSHPDVAYDKSNNQQMQTNKHNKQTKSITSNKQIQCNQWSNHINHSMHVHVHCVWHLCTACVHVHVHIMPLYMCANACVHVHVCMCALCMCACACVHIMFTYVFHSLPVHTCVTHVKRPDMLTVDKVCAQNNKPFER